MSAFTELGGIGPWEHARIVPLADGRFRVQCGIASLGQGVQTVTERALAGADPEAMIDLGQVEGRVRASAIHQVSELVDKHPEEAIAIIRKWLHEDS